MVVLVDMKIVVVVVDGHGGSVELVLDVGKVTGGDVVDEDVVERMTVVVVGHGPMPPPGSGQSRCVEVVVVEGIVVVGVQPNLARKGARAWRTNSLAPKSALTARSAWQMRAWKIELVTGGTWACVVCTWDNPAATLIRSTAHRRTWRRRPLIVPAPCDVPAPVAPMPPPFRLIRSFA